GGRSGKPRWQIFGLYLADYLRTWRRSWRRSPRRGSPHHGSGLPPAFCGAVSHCSDRPRDVRMRKIDRLLVIWGEPSTGSRHVIGHLARSSGEFRFWYEDDLAHAQEHGFQLLPEFPMHRRADDPYAGRYLFALFAERIPAPTRRDAADMLAAWG